MLCPWSRFSSLPFSWRWPFLGHPCVPLTASLHHRSAGTFQEGQPTSEGGKTPLWGSRNNSKYLQAVELLVQWTQWSPDSSRQLCTSLNTAVTLIALWRVPWIAKYWHYFIVCSPFYDFLCTGFMTGCSMWIICGKILVHSLPEKVHKWNRTSQSEVSKKVFPQWKVLTKGRENHWLTWITLCALNSGCGFREAQGAPTPAKWTPLLAHEPHPCHS